jgi:hypothetical protein
MEAASRYEGLYNVLERFDRRCSTCEGRSVGATPSVQQTAENCIAWHRAVESIRDFVREHEHCSVAVSRDLSELLSAVRGKAAGPIER